jgi:hypothetical protein
MRCTRISRPRSPLLATRLALALALGLGVAAAHAGEPIDFAEHDMRPLLRVQAAGADIAGGVLETDVVIHRGGPTLFAATAVTGGGSARVERALPDAEALRALKQALARSHVGRLRGGCGTPAPDHIARYTLVWYGQGGRTRTLQVGGVYDDCPEPVEDVFDAVCAYLWDTLESAIEHCAPPLR